MFLQMGFHHKEFHQMQQLVLNMECPHKELSHQRYFLLFNRYRQGFLLGFHSMLLQLVRLMSLLGLHKEILQCKVFIQLFVVMLQHLHLIPNYLQFVQRVVRYHQMLLEYLWLL